MKLHPITCPTCKRVFDRAKKQIADAIKQSGKWECRGCVTARRNRAGGHPIGSTRTTKKGYVEIKTAGRWMRRNRFVMEQKLGRPLLINEDVHHRNGIKTDDSPDNLEVLKHGEHTKVTHVGVKRSGESLRNIRQSFQNRKYAKLNPQLAASIRMAVKANVTQRSLAEKFRVSPMTINRVVHGQSWKRQDHT